MFTTGWHRDGDAIAATRRQPEPGLGERAAGLEAERAAADRVAALAATGVATQPSRWALTARPGP